MKGVALLNKPAKKQQLVLGILFLLFGALHLHISIVDHYLCRTNTYDYAVYNFAFYDFAHLRLSPCPIYQSVGDVNFLQDHFSLTLPILSPLYWIMSPVFGTYSLLIIQWVFIMLGGYATYKLILFKSGSFNLALCALLFYFTIYCRFAAYNSDCNLVIMGSALMPLFFYCFETKKLIPMILTFLVLVFNREDFSLGVMFFCLMLMALHRKDKKMRNLAAYMALSSLLCFYVIFTWIIPALETPNKTYNLFNYNVLGKNPREAILFIVSHPLKAVELLFANSTGDPYFDGIKIKFYVVLFLSGGFMLVYRPVYLIALIPLIAKKMWNDDPIRWSHEYYQGIEVATLMPSLVFLSVADLKWKRWRPVLSSFLCVLTIEVTLHQLYYSPIPYYGVNKCNIFADDFYSMTEDTYAIRELLKKVPDTSGVCASGNIAPHLAFRKNITLFPRILNSRYLFLEKRGATFPMDRGTYDNVLKEVVGSAEWLTLYDYPGVVLLRRR